MLFENSELSTITTPRMSVPDQASDNAYRFTAMRAFQSGGVGVFVCVDGWGGWVGRFDLVYKLVDAIYIYIGLYIYIYIYILNI